MLEVLTADDLARRFGYQGATSSFHNWCARMGITPVPGRRGYYDAAHVRQRLDVVQGMVIASSGQVDLAAQDPLVAARRARRGSV